MRGQLQEGWGNSSTGDWIYERLVTREIGSTRGQLQRGWGRQEDSSTGDRIYERLVTWGIGFTKGQSHGDTICI